MSKNRKNVRDQFSLHSKFDAVIALLLAAAMPLTMTGCVTPGNASESAKKPEAASVNLSTQHGYQSCKICNP